MLEWKDITPLFHDEPLGTYVSIAQYNCLRVWVIDRMYGYAGKGETTIRTWVYRNKYNPFPLALHSGVFG